MSSDSAVLPSLAAVAKDPAAALVLERPVAIDEAPAHDQTVFAILAALSLSHLLNDVMQSLIPAVYPVLKESYSLSFTQIGLITFAFQVTASLLQPVVGIATDRRPWPYSLAAGMAFTLVGLLLISVASTFGTILVAAALVGVGSSVFHPEASRVARMASGGQHGFAQSLFQVGGNGGTALGPLLAAFIVVPRGQASIAWFSLIALAAMGVLFGVGRWYRNYLATHARRPKRAAAAGHLVLSRSRVAWSIAILLTLVFSKYFYMASLTSYYTFYLMERFHVPVDTAQVYLFVFLGAVAVGTIAGGPVGDRIGFKRVIWGSILGVLPFSVALPHVNLFWTVVLSVPIGLILASAFSAIIVYAQELLPSRVGLVAGLFFGFAFGIAGVGAAVLGRLADYTSIEFVYQVCAYLPAIGLLTAFLPNLRRAAA
jgi:FSR family fosmidomycin resistance protein-like MFS transporter